MENNPNRPEDGTREVTFSRELYIEAEDFLETPVPKYKRLFPGGPECRLKGAYLIKCVGCVKDADGRVTEVLCEYDPDSRGGGWTPPPPWTPRSGSMTTYFPTQTPMPERKTFWIA